MTTQLRKNSELIAERLQQFIDWTGRLVSWLVLVMVLVTFLVVLLRYLFDIGWIGLQESVSYLHSMVFLIGAAYTMKSNGHVRVDIFYTRLSTKGKAWVDLAGHIFILLPVMIFISWISWPYIIDSWQVQESSRETGGLPGIFLLKSLILLMTGLLMTQAMALILTSILLITDKTAPSASLRETQ